MSFVFTLTLALTLLPLSLAAPSIQPRLAAINCSLPDQIPAHSTNGKYIVGIKPDTIAATPDARIAFITAALADQGIPMDDTTRNSLMLDWKEDIFNGFAGVFSPEAVHALQLRWTKEVDFIHEG